MQVLAALSGGVDSAVAAARAVDGGHDVVAVHLALSRAPATHRTGSRGCCTIEDSRDARRVADVLGIPFYVWDLSEAFERDVIGDFIAEYQAGRTPNPCVRCNQSIKFAAVWDRARGLGFDAMVTGHYAQILAGVDGPELHRGRDTDKDQSYVLGVVPRDVLGRTLLPLGASTKQAVRDEAQARGLLVARKPDSYDVCFIPDGDTAGFLRSRIEPRPGPIVDVSGAEVGAHDGAFAFTVGQRRGLGLHAPAADGRPRYVLSVEPTTATVTVGPREQLRVTSIRCSPVHLLAEAADLAAGDAGPTSVQWRAHGGAAAAVVTLDADRLVVELVEPAYGIAAGQELVVYRGSRVLASARVESTA
jgi:tRNA-specific 2-thiouridylase